MDFEEYNALGQALDTTFGRASTSGVSTHSLKGTLVGQDQIKVVYGCVVNLTTDREALQMKQRYGDESDEIIKRYVTFLKKNYKDISGKTISLKEVGSDVSFEMTNMNVFNRKRTAIFRRTVMFDVS